MNIDGVTLYGLSNIRVPTVIFNVKGMCSEEAAKALNERRICVRGGFHCAPLAHAAYSTGDCGAVRASLTFKNTFAEIDAFSLAINRI